MTEKNVFQKWEKQAWPFSYRGTISFLNEIHGGVPSSLKVARGWLASKFVDTDERIQRMALDAMAERNIELDEAVSEIEANLLKGFRRDDTGLYIKGYQLKAAIKEAASICMNLGVFANGKEFGKVNKKGLKSFLPEHVQVDQDRLYLKVGGEYIQQPTDVEQRFVHTWNGSGISYEEYVEGAEIDFTISTDWEFNADFWPTLWLKGGRQGLGATRSMGFGQYEITRWDQVS